MEHKILVISAYIFISFFISYLAVWFTFRIFQRRNLLAARLSGISSEGTAGSKEEVNLFHKKKHSIIENKLQQYVAKFKGEGWLQLVLYRAGISAPISRIVLFCIIMSFIVSFILSYYYQWSFGASFPTAMVAVVIGGMIILSWLRGRRQETIIKHLPYTLDIISRALKSGYSVEKTFAVVAQELHESVASEFQKIIHHIGVGIAYEDALRLAAERVHTSDFNFFVNSLIIQRRTGGSLTEILDNIMFLLHRRHEIRLKAKSLSAESKITGVILGSVPLFIWGAITAIKPGYMDFFFDTEKGNTLLYVVLGLIAAEIAVIKWLVNIKVE